MSSVRDEAWPEPAGSLEEYWPVDDPDDGLDLDDDLDLDEDDDDWDPHV